MLNPADQSESRLRKMMASLEQQVLHLIERNPSDEELREAEMVLDHASQQLLSIKSNSQPHEDNHQLNVITLNIMSEDEESERFVSESDGRNAKQKRLAVIKNYLSSRDRKLDKLKPIDISAAIFRSLTKSTDNNTLIEYFALDQLPDDGLTQDAQKFPYCNIVALSNDSHRAAVINEMNQCYYSIDKPEPPLEYIYRLQSDINERRLLFELTEVTKKQSDKDLRFFSHLLPVDYSFDFGNNQVYNTAYNNMFLADLNIDSQSCMFAFYLFKSKINIINISRIQRDEWQLQGIGGYFNDQSVTLIEKEQSLKDIRYRFELENFQSYSIIAFHLCKQTERKWQLTLVRKGKKKPRDGAGIEPNLEICVFSFQTGSDKQGSIEEQRKTIHLEKDFSVSIQIRSKQINFITSYRDMIIYTDFYKDNSSICILYNKRKSSASIDHSNTPINRVDVADFHGVFILAVQDYSLELTYYCFYNGELERVHPTK